MNRLVQSWEQSYDFTDQDLALLSSLSAIFSDPIHLCLEDGEEKTRDNVQIPGFGVVKSMSQFQQWFKEKSLVNSDESLQ
jgi:hypothetical protein